MGRMKIVDCNMVSHSSRSLMDTSPSHAARLEKLHTGTGREEAEVKNEPEVFMGKPPCS